MTPLDQGLAQLGHWQAQWPPFQAAPELALDDHAQRQVLSRLVDRLTDNYPFFHPHYAGQMLKPPHPIAAMAYYLAMQINPNNHALDGGPATAKMEKEIIADLARMFGFRQHLGHLTSSGTIANLEALWIARSLHPGKKIAFSLHCHYTHPRMCEVLGVAGVAIQSDAYGRLDLGDLLTQLQNHEIGTVVATAGSTGLGAIDPIDRLVQLGQQHGFRVHVDAAYGGFFKLLADLSPSPIASAPFQAIAQADSVVVDPHKHGLQPYGCGAVLFRDPEVGRFYQHDSPYTYFTSDELHLGEISLECSRAGAAAAALWATLQCFPLKPDQGLGMVLQATRQAALSWAAQLQQSQSLRLVMEPELDIVAFYPQGTRASLISQRSQLLFERLMNDAAEPVYLATLRLSRSQVQNPEITWDQDHLLVLRSALMKPEHAGVVDWLHARIEREVSRLQAT